MLPLAPLRLPQAFDPRSSCEDVALGAEICVELYADGSVRATGPLAWDARPFASWGDMERWIWRDFGGRPPLALLCEVREMRERKKQ